MIKTLVGILALVVIFRLAFAPEFAVYLLIGLILLLCLIMFERILQS